MSSVEAARPSVAVSIRTSDPLQQTQRPCTGAERSVRRAEVGLWSGPIAPAGPTWPPARWIGSRSTPRRSLRPTLKPIGAKRAHSFPPSVQEAPSAVGSRVSSDRARARTDASTDRHGGQKQGEQRDAKLHGRCLEGLSTGAQSEQIRRKPDRGERVVNRPRERRPRADSGGLLPITPQHGRGLTDPASRGSSRARDGGTPRGA